MISKLIICVTELSIKMQIETDCIQNKLSFQKITPSNASRIRSSILHGYCIPKSVGKSGKLRGSQVGKFLIKTRSLARSLARLSYDKFQVSCCHTKRKVTSIGSQHQEH